jgi:hypothetical protein
MTQSAEDSSTADSAPAQGECDAALNPAVPSETATPHQSAASPWGLSFYLFVEPLATGKVVVDLSARGGPGAELLRKAGALEVLSPSQAGLPLPFPDGCADIVMCALTAVEVGDDGQRAALFAELYRIMRRDGLCVVRVVAATLENAAVGVSLRAALADMALQQFATVDIVEETPFRAVSYFVPGSDELAVSEAMARVGGNPSHLIALCAAAAEHSWRLSESLLVPTGPGEGGETGEGEMAAWRAEVTRLSALNATITREREDMRERQMTLQDRSERLDKTVSNMRKDVERYLRQMSDDAAARELLSLERDQLLRKLASAEGELEAANHEIENQKSSAQALRKEVARLRAARGSSTGPGRGPA